LIGQREHRFIDLSIIDRRIHGATERRFIDLSLQVRRSRFGDLLSRCSDIRANTPRQAPKTQHRGYDQRFRQFHLVFLFHWFSFLFAMNSATG
jgi:hypothetical protein